MPENNILVIDNFLPKDVFLPIQRFLMSNLFPWYYNDCTTFKGNIDIFDYQFVHNFYRLKEGIRDTAVISEFKIIGKVRLVKSNSRNFSVNGKLPILNIALYKDKENSSNDPWAISIGSSRAYSPFREAE